MGRRPTNGNCCELKLQPPQFPPWLDQHPSASSSSSWSPSGAFFLCFTSSFLFPFKKVRYPHRIIPIELLVSSFLWILHIFIILYHRVIELAANTYQGTRIFSLNCPSWRHIGRRAALRRPRTTAATGEIPLESRK